MAPDGAKNEDLREGYGRVYLPYALVRKYPGAPLEWGWQSVFPGPDAVRGVRAKHVASAREVGSGGLAPPGAAERAAAMILSLMVLFLCFTALSQSPGFVCSAGVVRYNRRHEIVEENLDLGQFSSRTGF